MGCETGLGMRVTEVMSGGDFHGMKATHLRLLAKLSINLVTCKSMVEHSKTCFKRYCSCLALALGDSQLNLEKIVCDYPGQEKHTRLRLVHCLVVP